MYEFLTDYERMRQNIIQLSRDYFKKNNIHTAILGVSGGIDSALTAALMFESGVSVVAVILPLTGNTGSEMDRARLIGEAFGITVVTSELLDVVITMMRKCFGHTHAEELTQFKDKVRLGNIKARARMIYLYDLAKRHDGLVLSTDNFTEYLLGFWTLHGDVGDFGPIQNLWKTEVYGLSKNMMDFYADRDYVDRADALKFCINAVPTDGLGISKSDFDQIYADYNPLEAPEDIYKAIDNVLYRYINNLTISENNQIIARHRASEFKRQNPISISRAGICK